MKKTLPFAALIILGAAVVCAAARLGALPPLKFAVT
jgi:hypothetical protein